MLFRSGISIATTRSFMCHLLVSTCCGFVYFLKSASDSEGEVGAGDVRLFIVAVAKSRVKRLRDHKVSTDERISHELGKCKL